MLMLIMIEALRPKWSQSRREERGLVNPNKRGATPSGSIWGAALRDRAFLHSSALYLAGVQQAHGARYALLSIKNDHVATTRISMGRL